MRDAFRLPPPNKLPSKKVMVEQIVALTEENEELRKAYINLAKRVQALEEAKKEPSYFG